MVTIHERSVQSHHFFEYINELYKEQIIRRVKILIDMGEEELSLSGRATKNFIVICESLIKNDLLLIVSIMIETTLRKIADGQRMQSNREIEALIYLYEINAF